MSRSRRTSRRARSTRFSGVTCSTTWRWTALDSSTSSPRWCRWRPRRRALCRVPTPRVTLRCRRPRRLRRRLPSGTSAAARRRAKISGGSLHGSASVPARASRIVAHTRSGVHGRSMWRTPRCATASITAFCTAGVEPIVAASPMPFAPSGLSGVGVCGRVRLERGQFGGGRDAVVGEVRRHRVAVGVEAHLLEQAPGRCRRRCRRAAGPRRAAVRAPCRSRRRPRGAAGVTLPVSASTSTTAMWAPNGNVAPSWWKSNSPSSWSPTSAARAARSPHPMAWAGTPATPIVPVGGVDDDVGDVGFEEPGGELPGLGDHRLGGATDGRPTDLQRARSARSAAGAHAVGVAVDERDPIDRDAGLIGDEHGVGGLVALPVRLRAGVDRGRPVVVHLDRAELVGASAGGDLDICGDADARAAGGRRSLAARPVRRGACRSRSASAARSSGNR